MNPYRIGYLTLCYVTVNLRNCIVVVGLFRYNFILFYYFLKVIKKQRILAVVSAKKKKKIYIYSP